MSVVIQLQPNERAVRLRRAPRAGRLWLRFRLKLNHHRHEAGGLQMIILKSQMTNDCFVPHPSKSLMSLNGLSRSSKSGR